MQTDYVDHQGRNVFAYDKGYASVVKNYNDLGQNDVITYLDAEGNEVKLTSGYSSIHRTYYGDGKADTDTYYYLGEQVSHREGYYGYKRTYENGRISLVSYLDKNGDLTPCKKGYAMIERTYNSAGKLEYEFYLDTNGQPAKGPLGQYGVYREYDENGTTIVTTYLDAEGNPLNTTKGYATVRREGDKRRYYDSEGNPATAGRFQYGYETIDGRTVYLDEDGEPVFRLDNFLLTHPLFVMVCGTLLTGVACLVKGKARAGFLILYVLFILMMTLWYRESGESTGRFDLFWSYRRFFMHSGTRRQILENIWLFIPFGATLYKKDSRRWLIPLVLSICIEAIQYFAGIGLCEFDDVVSNSLGGVIGYMTACAVGWSSALPEKP